MRLFIGISLLIALIGNIPSGLAQEAGGSPDDFMKAYQQAAEVGEQQKDLAKAEGIWDITTTLYVDPEKPHQEQGEAVRSMKLGGRVMEELVTSTMMGQPMHGIGLTGYDNVTGRWWSTWTDNMSTGISTFYGHEEGGKLIFEGTSPDPLTGGMEPMRIEFEKDGDDKEISVFYTPGADGKMTKMMEMVYERR